MYLCPDCNSTDVILDQARGELICRDCGLVVEEKIAVYEIDLIYELLEQDLLSAI